MVREVYKILSNEEEEEIARDESQFTSPNGGVSNPTLSQAELLKDLCHMHAGDSGAGPSERRIRRSSDKPSTSMPQRRAQPHRQDEVSEVQQRRAAAEEVPLQPTAQARHQAMPPPPPRRGPTDLQPPTQQVNVQVTPVSDRKRMLVEIYDNTEQELRESKIEIEQLKAKLEEKERETKTFRAEAAEAKSKLSTMQKERDTASEAFENERSELRASVNQERSKRLAEEKKCQKFKRKYEQSEKRVDSRKADFKQALDGMIEGLFTFANPATGVESVSMEEEDEEEVNQQ